MIPIRMIWKISMKTMRGNFTVGRRSRTIMERWTTRKRLYMIRGGIYIRTINKRLLRVGILWKCQVLTVRRLFWK